MKSATLIEWTIAIVIIIMFGVIMLDAIEKTSDAPNEASTMHILSKGSFFVDSETGCHYVITTTSGITPRLNSDGQPMCLTKDMIDGK